MTKKKKCRQILVLNEFKLIQLNMSGAVDKGILEPILQVCTSNEKKNAEMYCAVS